MAGAHPVRERSTRAPLAVYQAQIEDCEYSFGACSTFNIDTASSLLVGPDNFEPIRFDFVRPMESFTLGKLYGAGLTTVRFYRGATLLSTEVIDRSTAPDCTAGSGGTWTPAGGFDRIELSGGRWALTDLRATYR